MTFNSITFAVFLPVVFVAYWWHARFGSRVQNILLLIASYVFYGWWDYRFLSLVVLSSAVDCEVVRLSPSVSGLVSPGARQRGSCLRRMRSGCN